MSLVTPSTSNGRVLPRAAKEFLADIQGVNEAGGAGGETAEVKSALAQFNDARNAPGFALPGGYTNAVTHIGSMSTTGGAWQEVTNVPYNSDDIRYRDYYANTTAGVGFVTGRVQALAAGDGYLFAAGAVGGVYRYQLSSNGPWESISEGVPALSSGALAYRDHRLWYATGDGATGATTYTGDGVWVSSANPTSGAVTWSHLAKGAAVGSHGPTDTLFDGSVIQQFRFGGDWVYVPTSYGVWRHSATDLSESTPWEPVFVPAPQYLPTAGTSTGTHSTDNYTTDVAIDPQNSNHVVVALGWVAGGSANGWYEGGYDGTSWHFTRSNVTGAINPKDIGRTTFAWGTKKLYALVHNPDHAAMGVSYSELGGVYVSKSGSITGPWSKIADTQKLAQSGSALDPTINHAGAINGGYQPGVQAWYNQFLTVDPANDDHVYLGLEEVFETKNGGANWSTPGPYWNFFFPCWNPNNSSDERLGCPLTTHPDQHAVTIYDGKVYVGNDGGVYARPVAGSVDSANHANDWTSLTEHQTPDFLQYYGIGIGKVNPAKSGYVGTHSATTEIVSGGLQDVGGSILFSDETTMGSNFGGDGGDVLVDPNDGCRIVQEYVDLAMRVTNVCAATSDINSFLYLSHAKTRSIKPPETSARFTAPFAADHQDINNWVAGGRHVWLNTKGFNIASGSDWVSLIDLGLNESGTAAHTATAVASDGGNAIAAFCGSCNAGDIFESGYAIGRADKDAVGGWTKHLVGDAQVLNSPDPSVTTLPNRYIAGADVRTEGSTPHYLLAFNGFSRRWVEGPGAGIGHVFTSTDGEHWYDLSGDPAEANSLPDVPANTVKWLADGRIVVGTDLGAFIGTPNAEGTSATWQILGSGLPATVVNDLEPGPAGDNFLYAGTYGRGIWKIALDAVPHYAGGDESQDTYWNCKTDPSSCPSAPSSATTSTGGTTHGKSGSGTPPARKP